jgi:hypothetical protein
MDVTLDELHACRGDKSVGDKFAANILEDLLLELVGMLDTDTKEHQMREQQKNSQPKASAPVIPSTISGPPHTPPPHHPRFPQSFKTPVNAKRNFSDTSFGAESTETTPTKLTQPEAHVQSLQNTFVNVIMRRLWSRGQLDVPWAEGRQMFLTYDKYFPLTTTLFIFADCRTCNTSFQYTMHRQADKENVGQGEILLGRVKAIADGALRLKTNKIKSPSKFVNWSKQRCALLFEVSDVCSQMC